MVKNEEKKHYGKKSLKKFNDRKTVSMAVLKGAVGAHQL